MIQNADPSHSNPLCTSSEPEILNRAASTVEIGIAHRGPSQHMPAAPLPGAGHTKIDRRFFDPFQFETAIEFGPGPRVSGRRFGIDFAKQRLDRPLRIGLADDHEIPRLHEPDRAGMVSSGQQSRQYVVGNRRRQKIPTDIPAFEDCPVHCLPLRSGKLAVVARRLLHVFTPSADRLFRKKAPVCPD